MDDITFSAEEISALRAVFSLFDTTGTGTISGRALPQIYEKIGRDIQEGDKMDDTTTLTFDAFLELVAKGSSDTTNSTIKSGPDPKVVEFIAILEEYRGKCEQDGNYLEAERADGQLKTLRKQEKKRQSKGLKARQIAERQDVQIAHNLQFTDFNQSWDRYMEEYDGMAQSYIRQMTEEHAVNLKAFQEQVHQDILDRPPKFSKELIEMRRRQHMLARTKNYGEAQKVKSIADDMEDKERLRMNDDYKSIFERREHKFRLQQQTELQALLKRIDGRRKEHVKQRNLDSKRLLQRNRNVQAVLESKQSTEASRKMADISKELAPKDRMIRSSKHTIPAEARVIVQPSKQQRGRKSPGKLAST